MNGMTDLAEFLLARIAEDEAVARQRHLQDWPDRLARQSEQVARLYGDRDAPEGEVKPADALWWSVQDALAWLARHNPARVLAECEAKRRIVEIHEGWHVCPDEDAVDDDDATEPPLCLTVRALAVPYAYHPDYDESWRP